MFFDIAEQLLGQAFPAILGADIDLIHPQHPAAGLLGKGMSQQRIAGTGAGLIQQHIALNMRAAGHDVIKDGLHHLYRDLLDHSIRRIESRCHADICLPVARVHRSDHACPSLIGAIVARRMPAVKSGKISEHLFSLSACAAVLAMV
ncbi:hypothetical protein SDC9_153343 [bioreactor metagenome]|uniref:Uncharacterized protein n=1 Tax=bioreactor metagenome TaxID=1076179 RepID=A0A645EVL7_9ZZZZ